MIEPAKIVVLIICAHCTAGCLISTYARDDAVIIEVRDTNIKSSVGSSSTIEYVLRNNTGRLMCIQRPVDSYLVVTIVHGRKEIIPKDPITFDPSADFGTAKHLAGTVVLLRPDEMVRGQIPISVSMSRGDNDDIELEIANAYYFKIRPGMYRFRMIYELIISDSWNIVEEQKSCTVPREEYYSNWAILRIEK